MIAAAAALLVLALDAPPARGPWPRGPYNGPPRGASAWYLALLQRYASGDRASALRESFPAEKILMEIRELARLTAAAERCGSCPLGHLVDTFPFEAAVMLHTDRAFAMSDRGDPDAEAEIALPPRIVEVMPEERRRLFEPRWVRAVALHLGQEGRWELALGLLDPATRRYETDPLLLLAQGALLEARSRLDNDSAPTPDRVNAAGVRQRGERRPGGDEKKLQQEAEKSFRRALAVQPDLHHARVRLGRVLALQDRLDEAARELQAVVAATTDTRELYFAHLFLGFARERAGQPGAAADEYERAVAALPDGQAASVALSHALHRTGRWSASVGALQAGVARAGRRQLVDPWWPYVAGQSEDAGLLLNELRAEVTR
jgi:tetratricopeptide (TPR) repeat protein